MILYHGTTVNIERIDFMKSKPNKDFGRAFYLSEDYNQALEMAQFNFQYAFCTQRAIDKLIKQ